VETLITGAAPDPGLCDALASAGVEPVVASRPGHG